MNPTTEKTIQQEAIELNEKNLRTYKVDMIARFLTKKVSVKKDFDSKIKSMDDLISKIESSEDFSTMDIINRQFHDQF